MPFSFFQTRRLKPLTSRVGLRPGIQNMVGPISCSLCFIFLHFLVLLISVFLMLLVVFLFFFTFFSFGIFLHANTLGDDSWFAQAFRFTTSLSASRCALKAPLMPGRRPKADTSCRFHRTCRQRRWPRHFVVPAAQATIQGPEDVYVKKGSTISLTCSVNVHSTPPSSVLWYHGPSVVDFDSPRGGISLETEKTESGTTSKLLVTKAALIDSGNYTCVPSNANPASVWVHVLNGEYYPLQQRRIKSDRFLDTLNVTKKKIPKNRLQRRFPKNYGNIFL